LTPFNAAEHLLAPTLAAGNGSRVAIRYRGHSVTYEELSLRIQGAAGGLRKLGVRPEERVVLVLLDSPEFIASFLGAMRIGAIPVPLNPLLPGRDLGLIAADARARVAVVSPERAEVVLPGLADGARELRDVVIAGDTAVSVARVAIHTWPSVMMSDADGAAYETWEDSPGFWLCTSGTTGRPKLAMHRHVDLRMIAQGYAREVLDATTDDRFYSAAPLFHAYGLGNSLVFPLSVGATTILEPTRPPAPPLIAAVLNAERPTHFFSVPTSYGALLAAELPRETFLPVRRAVSAGEPLPAEFFTRFRERFGVEILDGIGSTELTHIFISNRAGSARPGSSGVPVGGYTVELRDDVGAPLPLGSSGHLFVRGETAATGYWCKAEVSRATFRGQWVSTGDMYASTEDGFFSYLGRHDDMMKVGGEWVSPAEVEEVLLRYPGVLEAAVVAETTTEGLTHPIAYVVPAPGVTLNEAAVIVYCREYLAGYKRPRRLIIASELPKTATGKIQRAEIRRTISKA
jgi:benzoate-CoA ligase family protein